MSSTLKHRTLSSAIGDRLRQDIIAGAYPSGAQLRQDALASTYGVSRIPVREALFQLEAEGLVKIVPHKGAMVSGLSLAEINDVFDLRVTLEPRLLRASAPRLTEAGFARIDSIQAAFLAAMKARDIARWGELNADLHMALYAQAALPRTEAIVQGLLQTSDRYTRVQMSTRAAMTRAEDEHRTLVELCRKRHVADACKLLARHIEAVRSDLVGILGAAART
jgi:DNA-binding GntR family transcriptional regulator